MDAQSSAAPRKRVNGALIAGAIAVLLAAFVLIFAVSVNSSVSAVSTASEMGSGVTSAQEIAGAATGKSVQKVVAAGSALSPSAGGETISDDATPLSAYPVSNPLEGVTWLLIACIAGATVFFLVATRRMNRDIVQMKGSISTR